MSFFCFFQETFVQVVHQFEHVFHLCKYSLVKNQIGYLVATAGFFIFPAAFVHTKPSFRDARNRPTNHYTDNRILGQKAD